MADGLHFVPCPTVSNALKLLRAGNCYSAVFCALRMGQINGPELLSSIRSEFPRLPVIVVTKPKDLRFAILACMFGASDFIQTPLSAAKIQASLDRAMTRKLVELALPDGGTNARRKKPVSPPVRQSILRKRDTVACDCGKFPLASALRSDCTQLILTEQSPERIRHLEWSPAMKRFNLRAT